MLSLNKTSGTGDVLQSFTRSGAAEFFYGVVDANDAIIPGSLVGDTVMRLVNRNLLISGNNGGLGVKVGSDNKVYLKQILTGGAAGKLVVCYDATTGQLSGSINGTDCS